MEKLYDKIVRGEERRANLITLKNELKDEKKRQDFLKSRDGDLNALMKCLVDEDAKVRKNVAAILGILHWQDGMEVLMDAYREETQRFVRPEYIMALAELDCEEYLPEFHDRLDTLLAYEPAENEVKHVQEEIRTLQSLILRKEGIKRHTFNGFQSGSEIILTTQPAFRDLLAAEITAKKALLKGGVRTGLIDLEEIMQIRFWQEMLFLLNCGNKITGSPEELSRILAESDLLEVLRKNHREPGPFYFRVAITGAVAQEEKGPLTKKLAQELERRTGRELINSASHYEVEIRLMYSKEGTVFPVLKLFTLPDHRFDYRRYYVAASMKPSVAAGILALAKPYLTEYAQVLDPFCGVGTMLIERRFAIPVRNSYGIDTFGEAIEKAKANTKIAKLQVNYIHRDYFDFHHEYPFDEIITDMPAGSLSKEERNRIYRRFLEKSAEVLTEHGRIIVFTREPDLMKKYLRIQGGFRLLQQFVIQQKTDAVLFILEKK